MKFNPFRNVFLLYFLKTNITRFLFLFIVYMINSRFFKLFLIREDILKQYQTLIRSNLSFFLKKKSDFLIQQKVSTQHSILGHRSQQVVQDYEGNTISSGKFNKKANAFHQKTKEKRHRRGKKESLSIPSSSHLDTH